MRISTSQDADVVRPLLASWRDICRTKEFGLTASADGLIADLKQWLAASEGTLILAHHDDVLVGFLAIFAVKSTVSRDRLAIEKYWYAQPQEQMAGVRLFAEGRQWAIEHGCSHLIIAASQLSSHHYANVVRFCQKQGMREFETTYIEQLPTPQPST
jgi:hypothetical protein